MLLPTKHLPAEQSLLWIGAEILTLLNAPKTVSRVWEELRKLRKDSFESSTVTYDWFVLALDVLYMFGAIELHRGKIRKIRNDSPHL